MDIFHSIWAGKAVFLSKILRRQYPETFSKSFGEIVGVAEADGKTGLFDSGVFATQKEIFGSVEAYFPEVVIRAKPG